MSERVEVRELTDGEYAVRLHDGQDATDHRFVVSTEFLNELLMPEVDPERVVEETGHYLLEHGPAAAVPHDVDLEKLRGEDARFFTELQERLAG